jgi:hypothetical protein
VTATSKRGYSTRSRNAVVALKPVHADRAR